MTVVSMGKGCGGRSGEAAPSATTTHNKLRGHSDRREESPTNHTVIGDIDIQTITSLFLKKNFF